MRTAIFYDTETSGLPDFKAPSESEHQPHIVQLAAAMVDLDTREIIQSIDLIVRPDGWVIPDEVAKVHGITQDKALALGVPELTALQAFLHLLDDRNSTALRYRVAHNESFDARIIRIALKRYTDEESADKFKSGEAYCTMRESTSVVKCPPTAAMRASGRHHYKNPRLEEAYKHFFGAELVGAHNAMVDVKACIDVYFALQDLKQAA